LKGVDVRTYAPFFNGIKSDNVYFTDVGTWMVIFQDPNEKEWYIEVPDAGSRGSAVRLADALNAAEQTKQ
jgi:hypothetical protein